MPRYFFNVRNLPPARDDIGEELPNDHAAWREATRFTAEIFKDVDGNLPPGSQWGLDVIDENNRAVFQITITTTVMK
jgi:hypothetical protein